MLSNGAACLDWESSFNSWEHFILFFYRFGFKPFRRFAIRISGEVLLSRQSLWSSLSELYIYQGRYRFIGVSFILYESQRPNFIWPPQPRFTFDTVWFHLKFKFCYATWKNNKYIASTFVWWHSDSNWALKLSGDGHHSPKPRDCSLLPGEYHNQLQ